MFRDGERVVLRRWPTEGEDLEFTLTYRGPIPPEQRGVRNEKHDIRRQIHPQMRQWWRECPSLKLCFEPSGNPNDRRSGIEQMADEYAKFGFRWLPLVQREEKWACSLTVSLLVRQPPFGAFNGTGDLDNRVKTLIDGLCAPRQKGDLPENAVPSPDEDPFYCLLEDDSLVYDFSVNLDRLLRPPSQVEAFNDVEATIRAKILKPDHFYHLLR